MTLTVYEMDDEKLSRAANNAMGATLFRLHQDGLLTSEQLAACDGYAIVIVKKGWFRERLESLLKLDAGVRFACVKLVETQ